MQLDIIGLPLGNAQDISLRAIDKLKTAQLIICEDTRQLHRLWQKLATTNLLPQKTTANLAVLTDYNETKKVDHLLDLISTHQPAILVSDAGMPLISDPGYKLVVTAIKSGVDINVVPGPTAATTALALSGLPSDRFIFVGFLPQKKSKIQKVLGPLSQLDLPTTIILYESPYRLLKTIDTLAQFFPLESQVVIAKELTKSHQQIFRGALQSIKEAIPSKNIKGEFVILLRP